MRYNFSSDSIFCLIRVSLFKFDSETFISFFKVSADAVKLFSIKIIIYINMPLEEENIINKDIFEIIINFLIENNFTASADTLKNEIKVSESNLNKETLIKQNIESEEKL
jgi:hypothetical protein